jgi:hypothetical protein
MKVDRRSVLKLLTKTSATLPVYSLLSKQIDAKTGSIVGKSSSPLNLGYRYTDVTQAAGLRFRNYGGGEKSKKYILETTTGGVAFLDYDNDGWLDIFPRQWLAAGRFSGGRGTYKSAVSK